MVRGGEVWNKISVSVRASVGDMADQRHRDVGRPPRSVLALHRQKLKACTESVGRGLI